ncbi:MAG: tRNA lysidine(34) synthetase TilS [Verrucomicrobia bacterium]|nr:tRNA lysidine(34) synthetase TilS [Verrucomicrobiota bacterium]
MKIDQFLVRIREEYSIRRKYLIGVSGGRDSVALLHLLHAAGFRKLVVCHLNHALRGRASTQDAAFVKRLADRLDYSCEVQRTGVKGLAKENKVSIEVAARNARHSFFAQATKVHRCPRIFLAHHADDQVETVLINLFRGTGLRGIAGMRAVAAHKIDGRKLQFLRPLLEVWRTDINTYLTDNGIAYRDDASNESDFALRNRVRLSLLPELKRLFERDVRGAVHRLSQLAESENDALETFVNRDYPEFCQQGKLSVKALRALPAALQRRVIRKWLNSSGITGTGYREIEEVRSLIPVASNVAKINLPHDRHARRRAGEIFINPA